MPRLYVLIAAVVFLAGCATEHPNDLLNEYVQLRHTGVVDAPKPVGGRFAPADRDAVDRGRYLVELLGCGSCHTNGSFEGAPDMDKALAGSQTGIAWTSPLETPQPGVVYPPNITPDEKTGLGAWTDEQIARAIRAGAGRHGSGRLITMPWQSYARLSDEDVDAIVAYLRSIPAIVHRVPDPVAPGQSRVNPFVHFGVYRSRD